MTFEIGKTYRTRGGDLVRVTKLDDERDTLYPVDGEFLSGAPDPAKYWTIDGRYYHPSHEDTQHPHDLLPTPVDAPAPADRVAVLEAALREWWRLSLVISSAIRADQPEQSDAITAVVHQTRKALGDQP